MMENVRAAEWQASLYHLLFPQTTLNFEPPIDRGILDLSIILAGRSSVSKLAAAFPLPIIGGKTIAGRH